MSRSGSDLSGTGCLNCRGKIREDEDAFRCENPRCGFEVPRRLFGREIVTEEVTELLECFGTRFLYGFEIEPGGEKGWASLELGWTEDKRIVFALGYNVDTCPRCKKGVVRVCVDGYVCSNASLDPPECDYVVENDNINPNYWPRDLEGDSYGPKFGGPAVPVAYCYCPRCKGEMMLSYKGCECESPDCGFCLSHQEGERVLGRRLESAEMQRLVQCAKTDEPADLCSSDGSWVSVRLVDDSKGVRLISSADTH